jgi:hypothetical protein
MCDSFGLGRICEELELLLGKSQLFAEFSASHQSFQVRWNHWPKVSALLVRKLKQMEAEGIDPAKIFLYGHSLGARMVIDAGIKFGPNRIGMIDGDESDWFEETLTTIHYLTACDPAGPEYYLYDVTTDAKKAAKNVQGIHTSILAGTMTRNCHQDFILGKTSISISSSLEWHFHSQVNAEFPSQQPKPSCTLVKPPTSAKPKTQPKLTFPTLCATTFTTALSRTSLKQNTFTVALVVLMWRLCQLDTKWATMKREREWNKSMLSVNSNKI